MKTLVILLSSATIALGALSGIAEARKGDRGENYDGLSKPRKVCHPEKQKDGSWKRVCVTPPVR
jgi:hypothetical protein